MSSKPLRIVQISDIHLYAGEDKDLLGVNTRESFAALLERIHGDKLSADLIILSGDLTQDGKEQSYFEVEEAISRFNVPVYCVPGNHDNGEVMQKVYPRGKISLQKQIIHGDWQIILLDSHVHAKVEGHLAEDEIRFMEKCLQEYPKHSALILFHHHPVPVGCAWLDKLGLQNADEFWQVVSRYPQVNTVIFGHVHQVCEGEKNSVRYFSAPSTCIQFKRQSADFALEELPPGFRVIDLYPKGEIKTHVCRLNHYIGKFEKDAKGY